jgi:phosphoglycolate phosphatase
MIEMSYKAVIFDLDGTLLNTLDDLTDSTNYALNECGFPTRKLSEIRRFVGDGMPLLIKRALPENADEKDYNKCFELFCEHYKNNMANKTAPYDGVCDVLENLHDRGIKTAIVTNKGDFAAQKLCRETFGDSVDTVVGGSPELPKKPAPDGVYIALERLGVDKNEAVFVGDSQVDYMTAKNAGLDCISVLWGFRERDELEKIGADCFCDKVSELEKMI